MTDARKCPNGPDCEYAVTEEGQRPRWRIWNCVTCGRAWRLALTDWRAQVPGSAVEVPDDEVDENAGKDFEDGWKQAEIDEAAERANQRPRNCEPYE